MFLSLSDVFALKQSAFGAASGWIWWNSLDCQGTETSVTNCSYSTDTSTCDHSMEAGVRCMAGELVPFVVRTSGEHGALAVSH